VRSGVVVAVALLAPPGLGGSVARCSLLVLVPSALSLLLVSLFLGSLPGAPPLSALPLTAPGSSCPPAAWTMLLCSMHVVCCSGLSRMGSS
jgi:hypothetical protein